MKNAVFFIFITILAGLVYVAAVQQEKKPITEVANAVEPTKDILDGASTKRDNVVLKTPPATYRMAAAPFVAQTYNNCGPATLSMVLSLYGKSVSQDELQQKMRPFANPAGGVDDKSIFADEFVTHAKLQGFESLHRPNGTEALLKKFIANDIPVVLRTWLSPGEDIGHFRIVRGYDDEQKLFIQDDSYQGADISYDYATFTQLWQPFNYGYILVYPKEKEAVVKAILADEYDERTAWQHALQRAEKEIEQNPSSVYPHFNVGVAQYHLNEYKKSTEAFDRAESIGLPPRMLWYQLEPFYAYQKIGNYNKVFAMTYTELFGGNMAFSELYQIRGEIFLAQGEKELAKQEFENALYYNQYYTKAADALKKL